MHGMLRPLDGIDKLTCRRGLALPDRGLNALYVGASAHSERVLRSEPPRVFRRLVGASQAAMIFCSLQPLTTVFELIATPRIVAKFLVIRS